MRGYRLRLGHCGGCGGGVAPQPLGTLTSPPRDLMLHCTKARWRGFGRVATGRAGSARWALRGGNVLHGGVIAAADEGIAAMALFDDIGASMLRRHEGGREIALGLASGARTLRLRFRHILGRLRGRAGLAPRPLEPRAAEPHPGEAAPGDHLAGPSFAAQEPDLAKESGPDGRQMSGWAMADPGRAE